MSLNTLDQPTLPNESAWRGIGSFLDDYVKIGDDDTVIIAYAPDSREPAAWVTAALQARGLDPRLVAMRPLRDKGFLDRLTAALPSPDDVTGRLTLLTFERDTMSHNAAIRTALAAYEKERCSVVRAMNAGPDLFSLGFRLTPDELSARNTAVLERCMPATRLRVETASGTRLRIRLDSERFFWVSNRGVWRPGKFVIVPCGEVATFPADISGTFVADFAINVNTRMDRDARLDTCPVVATIEQGRLVEYQCPDPDVSGFIAQCFSRPNARNVGELGFGTNCGVDSPIPLNSHINERRPGVHLGFGQHNQTDKLAGYSCDIHLDLIARGGYIWTDDDDTPIDLENLVPSSRPHPMIYQDEDVFSEELDGADCCGLTRIS